MPAISFNLANTPDTVSFGGANIILWVLRLDYRHNRNIRHIIIIDDIYTGKVVNSEHMYSIIETHNITCPHICGACDVMCLNYIVHVNLCMYNSKRWSNTSATIPKSPFLKTSFLIFCTLLPVALAIALMSSESPIPSSVPS